MVRFSMTMALLVAVIGLSACGSSPTGPSASAQGTFGAQVAAVCAQRAPITSVAITIDGVVAGQAVPGGAAVTMRVPMGSHSVSGVANTGLRWAADTRTLTTAAPDFIALFACA